MGAGEASGDVTGFQSVASVASVLESQDLDQMATLLDPNTVIFFSFFDQMGDGARPQYGYK